MTAREQAMRAEPDFPWLEAGDVVTVERTLHALGWLEDGERVLSADRAGDGNMNLTLRVVTAARRLVLKQARPWVEKYPEIAAPPERSSVEQRFYARVAGIAGVGDRMPRIVACSEAARILLMEDLEDARDMTSLYAGDAPTPAELDALADYAARLHAGTAGPPDRAFANRAMRTLDHEHIHRVPLDPGNGLDLDAFEPGLRAAANRLCADARFTALADETGRHYLSDGPHLVHGDYFPGSWVRTRRGLRIIDPEFAHCGAPEHDVGCAIAHLALAGRPRDEAERLLSAYRGHPPAPTLDPALLARYAAIETVRRLIGVAQLPIPPSRGERAALLERARAAMVDADRSHLFP
jgi:5-methylthioribose kinase